VIAPIISGQLIFIRSRGYEYYIYLKIIIDKNKECLAYQQTAIAI
jgi:hypothetical protein